MPMTIFQAGSLSRIRDDGLAFLTTAWILRLRERRVQRLDVAALVASVSLLALSKQAYLPLACSSF